MLPTYCICSPNPCTLSLEQAGVKLWPHLLSRAQTLARVEVEVGRGGGGWEECVRRMGLDFSQFPCGPL